MKIFITTKRVCKVRRKSFYSLIEAPVFNAVTANLEKEGLRKIDSLKPDLIILNIMMTYKNEGFELA